MSIRSWFFRGGCVRLFSAVFAFLAMAGTGHASGGETTRTLALPSIDEMIPAMKVTGRAEIEIPQFDAAPQRYRLRFEVYRSGLETTALFRFPGESHLHYFNGAGGMRSSWAANRRLFQGIELLDHHTRIAGMVPYRYLSYYGSTAASEEWDYDVAVEELADGGYRVTFSLSTRWGNTHMQVYDFAPDFVSVRNYESSIAITGAPNNRQVRSRMRVAKFSEGISPEFPTEYVIEDYSATEDRAWRSHYVIDTIELLPADTSLAAIARELGAEMVPISGPLAEGRREAPRYAWTTFRIPPRVADGLLALMVAAAGAFMAFQLRGGRTVGGRTHAPPQA